jgi:hypothetical protein
VCLSTCISGESGSKLAQGLHQVVSILDYGSFEQALLLTRRKWQTAGQCIDQLVYIKNFERLPFNT